MAASERGLYVVIDPYGVHPAAWTTQPRGATAQSYADALLAGARLPRRRVHTRDVALLVRLLRRVAEAASNPDAARGVLTGIAFAEVQRDGTVRPLELRADGTLHPESALLRGVFEDERERYDAALDAPRAATPTAPSQILHDAGPEPEAL